LNSFVCLSTDGVIVVPLFSSAASESRVIGNAPEEDHTPNGAVARKPSGTAALHDDRKSEKWLSPKIVLERQLASRSPSSWIAPVSNARATDLFPTDASARGGTRIE
jgi:hypothetical protein